MQKLLKRMALLIHIDQPQIWKKIGISKLLVVLTSSVGSDVNYARRDWDENVAFGGKLKQRQGREDAQGFAQGRRPKNFVQIRSVSVQRGHR